MCCLDVMGCVVFLVIVLFSCFIPPRSQDAALKICLPQLTIFNANTCCTINASVRQVHICTFKLLLPWSFKFSFFFLSISVDKGESG